MPVSEARKASLQAYYEKNRVAIKGKKRAYYFRTKEKKTYKAICVRYGVDTVRQWARDSRDRHKEKRNEAARRYYQDHKAASNAKSKEWAKNNRDKRLKNLRDYSQRHPEVTKAWRRANPDVLRAHHRNRKAREKGAGGSFTTAQIRSLYSEQQGRCRYCGCELDGFYHIEHAIPIIRGGHNGIENIRLSCATCNLRKGRMTEDEYVATYRLPEAVTQGAGAQPGMGNGAGAPGAAPGGAPLPTVQ